MKKQLHPITFEVRVKIKKIVQELPQVPFFMLGAKGKMIVQKVKTSRLISKKELLSQDPDAKVDGTPVAELNTSNFIQRGANIRMMNHAVTLNAEYQKHGDAGIQHYVDYVNNLNAQLNHVVKEANTEIEKQKSAEAAIDPNIIDSQTDSNLL